MNVDPDIAMPVSGIFGSIAAQLLSEKNKTFWQTAKYMFIGAIPAIFGGPYVCIAANIPVDKEHLPGLMATCLAVGVAGIPIISTLIKIGEEIIPGLLRKWTGIPAPIQPPSTTTVTTSVIEQK
jgi:hypothetical protein